MVSIQNLSYFENSIVTYPKGKILFREGEAAKYYFQIITGEVKVFNFNEKGKEFVQGFFKDGTSFGEPPLMGNFDYPANAEIIKETKMYQIKKEEFLRFLENSFDEHLNLTHLICNRLNYKARMLREISVQRPGNLIFNLLNYLKKEAEVEGEYEVTLTRKKIAYLTGLRLETVIRAIKKLKKKGRFFCNFRYKKERIILSIIS